MNTDIRSLLIPDAEGKAFEFRHFDTDLSAMVCREVLDGGPYPLLPEEVLPRDKVFHIVDIGANVGAATVMFATNYPKAHITAYEPLACCESLFRHNVAICPNPDRIELVRAAVAPYAGTARLFHGTHDSVQSSIIVPGLFSEDVTCVGAGDLPRDIDILKIDVEGLEFQILEKMWTMPDVVYVEYHDDTRRRQIDRLMYQTGHVLYAAHAFQPHRGELCYVNGDVLPDAMEKNRLG